MHVADVNRGESNDRSPLIHSSLSQESQLATYKMQLATGDVRCITIAGHVIGIEHL